MRTLATFAAGGPEANAALVSGGVPVNFFRHGSCLLAWQKRAGRAG